MVTGTIKIGKNTAKHSEWLKSKNYNVKLDGDVITVTGGGELLNEIDLGKDPVVALKNVADRGDLFSYSTRMTFPDGKILFGVPACIRLGQASALVVSVPKVAAPKTQQGYNF